MTETSSLKRTRSLKSVLHRTLSSQKAKEKARTAEDDSAESYRPVKQTFIQYHVTADDLGVRSFHAKASDSSRITPQRNTWPATPKERKPGSFAFDVPPTLVKTPWEYERARRPASQWSRSTAKNTRATLLSHLPREILHCIINQIRCSRVLCHTLDDVEYRYDLLRLCVTDKRLHRVAREHLYRDIWLPRCAGPSKAVFSLRKGRSFLRQLLRTLQEVPGIGHLIRRLHVTFALAAELDAEIFLNSPLRKTGALQTLRNIVLRCPNLDEFTGYIPYMVERTSGLFDALASCCRLKSHAWRMLYNVSDSGLFINTHDFVQSHAAWQDLDTLILWQDNRGEDTLEPGPLTALGDWLPSLKKLMVKGYPRNTFNEDTLISLPPLRSLRLEDLPGLTDQSIGQMAFSPLATSLETLVLSHLELTSLRTVEKLFSHLSCLQKFVLCQETSPELHEIFSITGSSFNLGSMSLRYLHWDTLIPGNATIVLANSIAAGKLPSLRKVIVPSDPDGAIQSLCRPLAHETITAVDVIAMGELEGQPGYARSLRASCLYAQLRIHETRRLPAMNVVISDEFEDIKNTYVIGSYIGDVASRIEYSLEPAIPGKDIALAQLEDVMRPSIVENGKLVSLLDYRVLF